jgi:CRISPR-associated protein Cas2
MSRTLYLVCYDVADARRLRRVHKLVMAYAIGGQKSFYECWLTVSELRELRANLTLEIDAELDRVHLFQLDSRMQPMFFGVASRAAMQPFMIV